MEEEIVEEEVVEEEEKLEELSIIMPDEIWCRDTSRPHIYPVNTFNFPDMVIDMKPQRPKLAPVHEPLPPIPGA